MQSSLLLGVLEDAGIKPGTMEILFTGSDHGTEKGYEHDYARSLSLAEIQRPEVLLAYEMNGRPLEPQHGFPLRLIVPGWYGMTHVKWLKRIDALTEPFQGYQQSIAYRYRKNADDPGVPVTRIKPRALMIPPGFPDFLTRHRTVERGHARITGRAWSGHGEITRVDFGLDGNWQEATLASQVGPFAWREWSIECELAPGKHVLTCRAQDAAGNQQPTEQPWNVQGMGNNLVQSVNVSVR